MALAQNGGQTENDAGTSRGEARINIGDGTKTGKTTISATSYTNYTTNVDISTLPNGVYEVEFEMKTQNATSEILCKNINVEVVREV